MQGVNGLTRTERARQIGYADAMYDMWGLFRHRQAHYEQIRASIPEDAAPGFRAGLAGVITLLGELAEYANAAWLINITTEERRVRSYQLESHMEIAWRDHAAPLELPA